MERYLEDSHNISKEDYEALADQIVYDFELDDLPKNIQDDNLKKLRENDFKHFFDIVKKSVQSSS